MYKYFKDGDEVKLTTEGLQQVAGADNAKYKPAHTGVVVGQQHGYFIKVKRHNRKSPGSIYHIDFWEKT